MQTTDEIEVDLVQMLYKACKKWRRIVSTALICMLLVGGFKFVRSMMVLNDPETFEKLKNDYEAELFAYESEGEQMKMEMNRLEVQLDIQNRYNEESMLMKLDADKVWNGKVNLYIDTDYQIMPGSVYQNENPAYKIVSAYADYAGSGDFYELVKEKLSFDVVDTKYLREILSIGYDNSRYAVTVNATADTDVHCKELIEVAKDALIDYKGTVETMIGEHELEIGSSSVYDIKDTDRKRMQLEQQMSVNDMSVQLGTISMDYQEWEEKEDEIKKPVLDIKDAIKNSIKWGILACVAVGFLMGGYYCLCYIFSGKVQRTYVEALGLNIIGELPTQSKGEMKGLDLLFCNMFGINMKKSEYTDRVSALSAYIRQLVKANEINQGVAVVTDRDVKSISDVVSAIKKDLTGVCQVSEAGDVQKSVVAVSEIENMEAVMFLFTEGVSTKKDAMDLVNKMNASGKKILGAVLLGVDAR